MGAIWGRFGVGAVWGEFRVGLVTPPPPCSQLCWLHAQLLLRRPHPKEGRKLFQEFGARFLERGAVRGSWGPIGGHRDPIKTHRTP